MEVQEGVAIQGTVEGFAYTSLKDQFKDSMESLGVIDSDGNQKENIEAIVHTKGGQAHLIAGDIKFTDLGLIADFKGYNALILWSEITLIAAKSTKTESGIEIVRLAPKL